MGGPVSGYGWVKCRGRKGGQLRSVGNQLRSPPMTPRCVCCTLLATSRGESVSVSRQFALVAPGNIDGCDRWITPAITEGIINRIAEARGGVRKPAAPGATGPCEIMDASRGAEASEDSRIRVALGKISSQTKNCEVKGGGRHFGKV